MKFLFSLTLLLAGLSVFAQKQINDPNVQLRTVEGSFHGISVSGGFDLYISPGNETVAVSASNPEYRDQIKTVIENGILKISFDGHGIKGIFKGNNTKLKAYVSYRTLSYLSASGGCDVFSEGVLKSSALKISLSGGCDFNGRLDVENLEVHQSGGTDLKVSGRASMATIKASGGSDFKGEDFVVDICDLSASGASDITIIASKELTASASGASDIIYKGTPQVKSAKSSGASSIKQKS